MANHQKALDTKRLEESRDDAGLYLNGAVKAVPLIGIAIANEIRDDELEVLRKHGDAVFPQVPPNWNAVNQ
jgi:hypothetical protein